MKPGWAHWLTLFKLALCTAQKFALRTGCVADNSPRRAHTAGPTLTRIDEERLSIYGNFTWQTITPKSVLKIPNSVCPTYYQEPDTHAPYLQRFAQELHVLTISDYYLL
jgi:hypothetical protein